MKKPPKKARPGDPVSASFFNEIIDAIDSTQSEITGLALQSGTGYRVNRSSNGTSLTIDRQPRPPHSKQGIGVYPGGFKCRLKYDNDEVKLEASGGMVNAYDGSEHEVEPIDTWKEICTLGEEAVSAYVDISLNETGQIRKSELTKERVYTQPFRPQEPDEKAPPPKDPDENNIHVCVEIAKVKIIPPEGEEDNPDAKPTYELTQIFEGTIELQLFGIEEQGSMDPPDATSYGGEYAMLKEMVDRTAILRKVRGEEGINLKCQNKVINVKLVRADSTSSTAKLGGVEGIEFKTTKECTAQRINQGIIEIPYAESNVAQAPAGASSPTECAGVIQDVKFVDALENNKYPKIATGSIEIPYAHNDPSSSNTELNFSGVVTSVKCGEKIDAAQIIKGEVKIPYSKSGTGTGDSSGHVAGVVTNIQFCPSKDGWKIADGLINVPLANTAGISTPETGVISGVSVKQCTREDPEAAIGSRIEEGVIKIVIIKETYPSSTSTYSSVPWDIE